MQICISPKQAYEWVKTGYWNLKQFQQWIDAIIQEAKTQTLTT